MLSFSSHAIGVIRGLSLPYESPSMIADGWKPSGPALAVTLLAMPLHAGCVVGEGLVKWVLGASLTLFS